MEGKIFISTSTFGEHDRTSLRQLKESGFEVVTNPYGRQLRIEESKVLLDGVIGLIAGTETLSEEVLVSATSLKAISRVGTGMDNVDLEAAKRLGIEVMNTPDAPTEAVAELTLGLILASYRKIPQLDRSVKCGKWPNSMGSLVYGKTLGVVGLGRIGKRVVELTAPFKVKVAAYDISPDMEFARAFNVRLLTLDGLLKEADIITLHIPLSPSTRGLISKEEFSLMKIDAVLINTSRGAIVDEDALIKSLRSKKIGGACLDVFGNEPYAGELQRFENTVLTPHIGTYAKEARIKMEQEAVDNILKALKQKERL